jgi:hypothetical protein
LALQQVLDQHLSRLSDKRLSEAVEDYILLDLLAANKPSRTAVAKCD